MQVRILLPFIDKRRLDPQLAKYCVDKPEWPVVADNSFVRCSGGKDFLNGSINLRRGMTFTSDTIHKMNPVQRSICFPYGNEIIGIYAVVLNFAGFKYRKMSATEIVDFLTQHLKISIRMLFDTPKSKKGHPNTRIQTNILTLKDLLPEHYYLSTLRLREKTGRVTKNSQKEEYIPLVDPLPEVSKDNIQFLTPVLSVDNSNLTDSKLKDVFYISIGRQITVGRMLYKTKINLYHFRRGYNPFYLIRRTTLSESNQKIEDLLLCDTALNALADLTANMKTSHDSSLLAATIKSSIDFCRYNKDTFGHFQPNGDRHNLLSGIRKSVNLTKYLNTEDKNALNAGIDELHAAIRN